MPPRKKAAVAPDGVTSAVDVKKVSDEKKQAVVLENLKLQVNQEIGRLVDLLIAEVAALESAKKRWLEEQALKERLQKQQEEEHNFQDVLDRRKKQAEFEEKMENDKKKWEEEKRRQEEAVRIKKENWEAKEGEYENLKLQTADFPKQFEKAVTEAKKQVSDLLKKDFEVEKKLMVQRYEAELKLLQQQTSALQSQLKQMEKESVLLKEEKNRAGEQMKEMAIAMVGRREQNPQTVSE